VSPSDRIPSARIRLSAGSSDSTPRATPAETFLQDCDAEIRREATAKTARQSLAVLGQPVAAAAWQGVASTYLVCAEDRGTPAELQREFARRAGSVVEIDAGHHSFLSQPGAVRDLVLSL
jgi:pimeloyl-ACP methyl ester carboxylesterase